MFNLKSLEVVHWDYWERFSLPLDAGIITVVGPNGSGKTTLLDALRTLLCIPCSSGRDYKRYVRRNGSSCAWLRTLVDNRRLDSGSRPFFPILTETVTLACRVRKNGGDWQRHYLMAEGDVPIEELERKGELLGVRDYRQRLVNAGLTPAIQKVLSLEQGDTDKLCEYSPKGLLDLVFSVFGDQEVLENYQQSKNEQLEIAREIESLETDLAGLGTRLREAEAGVNSYNGWKQLSDELALLRNETLPRARLADVRDEILRERLHLRKKRFELREQEEAHRVLLIEQQSRREAIEAAQGAEQSGESQRQELQERFQSLRDLARDAEKLVQEKLRLEAACRQGAEGFDAAEKARELKEARQELALAEARLSAIRRDRRELEGSMSALGSGAADEPPFARSMRAELDAAGIKHCLLTDLVEILDARWQGAVEAVLAPYAHLVLLEDPAQRSRAFEIGQRERYRHFIVGEREIAPSPARGSLAEVVQFHGRVAPWIFSLLDRISRVESVSEGERLPENRSWITLDGFHRERRGGRHIGVERRRYQFGEGARKSRLEELELAQQALRLEEDALQRRIPVLCESVAGLQRLLEGRDQTRELAARAEEFARAQQELPGLLEQTRAAGVRLAELLEASGRNRELRHRLEMEEKGLQTRLSLLERDSHRLRTEFQGARRAQADRILEYRGRCLRIPGALLSRRSFEELREKYESGDAVRRDILRQQQRLDEGQWVRDPSVLVKRDKLEADYRSLDETIKVRRVYHARHLRSTEDARESYINVLRATVRRYGKNVRQLGSLAGIDVRIEPPHLENDDLILSQAGLVVKFDFDQKGMIGLNDGEASGGQQVMKSLILLVGLLMDESRSGGFVFVDEPFAHLDVFNIDKVGAFLEATRAQYILTTPNTHNINVFKPSDLTLVTQKRKHPQKWAPPVGFIQRQREKEREQRRR